MNPVNIYNQLFKEFLPITYSYHLHLEKKLYNKLIKKLPTDLLSNILEYAYKMTPELETLIYYLYYLNIKGYYYKEEARIIFKFIHNKHKTLPDTISNICLNAKMFGSNFLYTHNIFDSETVILYNSNKLILSDVFKYIYIHQIYKYTIKPDEDIDLINNLKYPELLKKYGSCIRALLCHYCLYITNDPQKNDYEQTIYMWGSKYHKIINL
jgi:hypothetical protein